MLGHSLFLSLSGCAYALNARYAEGYGYGYGYGNENGNGVDASSSPSSKPTPGHSAPEYGHSAANSIYPTGGNGISVYPSPTSEPGSIVYTPYPSKPKPVHSAPGYGLSAPVVPYPTGGNGTVGKPYPTGTPDCAPYWLEDIKHQGLASFNADSASYQVFRNVKDFGAKGDGVADDTAAIQRAITEGNRCAPGVCESSTTTPAVVYFPGGTYVISSSIIDYYYTQIIGNPNCLPVIQASSKFNVTSGLGLIDGSPYQSSGAHAGQTGFGATNTFFRQIRNLILDMTNIPANASATGIHWPTAQTTSIQNVVFNMNAANGTQHQGLFIEQGSGGFMTDLVFNGGNNGFNVGNQQFTTRNLTFNNVDTAIQQLWDWGWTYKSVSINNCRIGLNMSGPPADGPAPVTVGSVTFIDSEINNTPIGILTSRTDDSEPIGAGALFLENVKLNNVRTAVQGPKGATYLAGSSGALSIDAWADGHQYVPNGPVVARGPIAPSKRPSTLLDASGKYYERSKPQYGEVPLSQFLSARDLGCAGDGNTDDTAALNAAILKAKEEGKILFIDAGFYKVTKTIYIPPGSRIVGEALASVILSSGEYFNSMESPKAVVQVAQPGERGSVELSDIFLSSQGEQKGAILMRYELGTYDEEPAGLWDVHTRIGGFAGSELQVDQCVKMPDTDVTADNLAQHCIAAYMSIHITKFATGLYMENNWLWTADHDIDDKLNNNTQLTIYAGRGLLVESTRGVVWLYGTAVEHHVKYEYQFVDTRDIFMGQIQTETAYYQPNPDARLPFPEDASLSDPVFTPSSNSSINAAEGWGLRILRSSSIFGYGVGLYSFFDNYSTKCSDVGQGARCQTRTLSIEGGRNSYDINLYNINTVGTTQMITRDGKDLAYYLDNNSTFVDTVNLFRINSFGL